MHCKHQWCGHALQAPVVWSCPLWVQEQVARLVEAQDARMSQAEAEVAEKAREARRHNMELQAKLDALKDTCEGVCELSPSPSFLPSCMHSRLLISSSLPATLVVCIKVQTCLGQVLIQMAASLCRGFHAAWDTLRACSACPHAHLPMSLLGRGPDTTTTVPRSGRMGLSAHACPLPCDSILLCHLDPHSPPWHLGPLWSPLHTCPASCTLPPAAHVTAVAHKHLTAAAL